MTEYSAEITSRLQVHALCGGAQHYQAGVVAVMKTSSVWVDAVGTGVKPQLFVLDSLLHMLQVLVNKWLPQNCTPLATTSSARFGKVSFRL